MKEIFVKVQGLFVVKKYDDALNEVFKILRNLPTITTSEVLTDRGYCKFFLGEIYLAKLKKHLAIKYFKEAASTFPQENLFIIDCYIKIAKIYEDLLRFNSAIEAYEKIIVLFPQLINPYIRSILVLAINASSQGDITTSLKHYHKVIDFMLRNCEIKEHFKNCIAYKQLGKFQKCFNELDQAIKLSFSFKEKVFFYFKKAEIYQEMGELFTSLALFSFLRTKLDNEIENPLLKDYILAAKALINSRLAVINFQLGFINSSQELFNEALSLASNDEIKKQVLREKDSVKQEPKEPRFNFRNQQRATIWRKEPKPPEAEATNNAKKQKIN